MHKIELPQRMVEQEFESIWRQIVAELGNSGRTFEDEGTTEEKARADYMARSPNAACGSAWSCLKSANAPMSR